MTFYKFVAQFRLLLLSINNKYIWSVRHLQISLKIKLIVKLFWWVLQTIVELVSSMPRTITCLFFFHEKVGYIYLNSFLVKKVFVAFVRMRSGELSIYPTGWQEKSQWSTTAREKAKTNKNNSWIINGEISSVSPRKILRLLVFLQFPPDGCIEYLLNNSTQGPLYGCVNGVAAHTNFSPGAT